MSVLMISKFLLADFFFKKFKNRLAGHNFKGAFTFAIFKFQTRTLETLLSLTIVLNGTFNVSSYKNVLFRFTGRFKLF